METATQERTETTDAPQLAPEPQLPAVVRQERKPRLPAQPRPAQYPASIAKAVIAVTREMEAVSKGGQHEFHKYRYARWEDINEQLSPLLAAHGLMMQQSEQSRTLLEQNDKGSVLAIVYHFTLIHESGDMAPAVEKTGINRLRDQKGITDDKAATKCHTQARKYFCLESFNIRVAEEAKEDQRHALSKTGTAREIYAKMQADIKGAASEVELATWGRDPESSTRKRALPADWQDSITTLYNEKMAELRGGPRVIWDEETGEVIDESAASQAADPAPASQPQQSPEAGAVLSAQAYVEKWRGIIQAATSATALHKAWSAGKAERNLITWPDDNTFANLKDEVERAINFMKQPAQVE